MDKRCMGCMLTYGEEFDVCPHCGYAEMTPAKEAYHIKPGTLLHGKYIVGKVVGYGGFGVTYVGWDNILQQKVAIKEYLPSEFATRFPGEATVTIFSGEKENQFNIGCDKFSGEAKRLAQFNSVDGVVEIKDTFRENGTAYIVMEFLEGETLKERIIREGRIAPDESLEIIKRVLETLELVHKENIIHRDISPDNIFLCSNGSVKLLDFGAARYATVQHSKSLSVILKEGYAPEEQYRSRGEQGPWSDVYATAATLYKMLTGITPEDAMERAENDKLKHVSKHGVKISKGVEVALMNALNVFAEDRTQTAQDFRRELESDEVKRKERTRKKIDIGKWPLWSKILVASISLFLVVSGVFLSKQSTYALEEGKAYVPEVINMKDDKAKKTVEKRNLSFKIIGQEKSDKVEKSRVMTQYPLAGRIVNEGEFVEVKISAGNEFEVVDVVGKKKDEAKKILETLGFKNIEFIEEESSAARGTVIKQSIKPGEVATSNTSIQIIVSLGITEINSNVETKVPNFVGLQFDVALDKAFTSKLYIEEGESISNSAPAGTILEQSIGEGTKVAQGTTVFVVVSAGPSDNKDVTVPYVEYLTESEAMCILEAHDLNFDVSYEINETVSKGLVVSQSVEAGKSVSAGTTIKLVVSKGMALSSVPDVVGLYQEDAESELLDAGYRYSIIYEHNEDYEWGQVISSYPDGEQEKGTKITINVSKGTAGKLISEEEYYAGGYQDNNKYSVSERYRYATRSKEYIYSGEESLDGYTLVGKEVISRTEEYRVKGSDAGIVRTDDYVIETTYSDQTLAWRNYAYVCDCNKSFRAKVDTKYQSVCKYCGVASGYKNALIVYTEISLADSGLSEYLGGRLYPNPTIQSGYDSYFGTIYGVYYNDVATTYTKSNPEVRNILLWQSENYPTAMYIYKKTIEKYKYEHWRWSDWSPWGEWTTREDTDNYKCEDEKIMYYIVGKEPN